MQDPKDLRAALEQFEYLIAQPNTIEPTWQKFFARYPFVFSMGLPLKLSPADIQPMGRPGRTEPDFLIFPGEDQPYGLHGIIEIKRHTDRVLKSERESAARPGTRLIELTSHAQTAVAQLHDYNDSFETFAPQQQATIGLSSANYLFLIMGSAHEIAELDPILKRRIHQDLKFAKLLGFDELLERYRQEVPPMAYLLQPSPMLWSMEDIARLLGPRLPYSKRLYRLVQAPFSLDGSIDLLDAPFQFVPPFDTRFRPAQVPAIYGAENPQIAQAETAYHLNKLGATGAVGMGEEHYSLIEFQFEGSITDIPNTLQHRAMLKPDDYSQSVRLANAAIGEKRDAIRYPSPRAGGHVLAIYSRASVFNARQLGKMTYDRRGEGWSSK